MHSYNPDMIDWAECFDDLEPGDFECMGGPDDTEIEQADEPIMEDEIEYYEDDIEYEEDARSTDRQEDDTAEPQEIDRSRPPLSECPMTSDILVMTGDVIDHALKQLGLLRNLRLCSLNEHGEYSVHCLAQETIERLEMVLDRLFMADESDPNLVNLDALTLMRGVIDDYALGTFDLLRNLRLRDLNEPGESVVQCLIQDTITRLEIAHEHLGCSAC